MNETEIKNIKGLTNSEVDTLQTKFGYNELPSSKKRTFLILLLKL